MADIERVIAKVFGNNTGSGSSGSSAKRQRLQQEGLRLVRGSATETRDVVRHPSRLAAFAVVGLTEAYPRFIALASLVLGWPDPFACLPQRKLHANPRGRPFATAAAPCVRTCSMS